MNIEFMGLSDVNGPLIALDGVTDACYEEMVDITVGDNDHRVGRIIRIEGDKAIVQVFEGTEGISLTNTRTRLTGHPLELPVARDMLGRVFDGAGRPIDGLGDICPEKRIDVNGMAINPVSREYPRDYIRTGISSIDGLCTLIKGQKLPIFSGSRHEPQRARRADRPDRRTSPAATTESSLRRWASRTTSRTTSAAPSRRPAFSRAS